MNAERRVRLFRNGGNRAVRIPKDLDFDVDEVMIRREGDRIVIEPVPTDGLLEFLDDLAPFEEPFPSVTDDDLPPLDEPRL